MMLSNLNLSSLPECNFEVRYVDSVLLNPCAEYQRLLRMGKVARIAANFSEYIANEPKVSYRDGRYFVFDGQNTIEARKTCNGGRDLPIRCKVFYGLSKEHEALLFAVQTGISSELTAGEQLRAKLVAHEENACDFAAVTENTGVRFALDGERRPMNAICDTTAKSETLSVKGCKVKITYAPADTDCLDAIQKLLQTTILRTAGHTAA